MDEKGLSLIEVQNFAHIARINWASYLNNGSVLTALINTPQFTDDLNVLVKFLAPMEQEKAERLPTKEAEQRFIIHRALLRIFIAKLISHNALEVAFEVSPHGKYYLGRPSNNLPLQFNLSHSENYALFAFSRHIELGIDIEEEARVFSLDALCSLALANFELRQLGLITKEEQPRALLKLWTQKEAISKAWGQGLALDFKKLALGFDENSKAQFMTRHQLRLYDLSRPPYFFASLALDKASKASSICL